MGTHRPSDTVLAVLCEVYVDRYDSRGPSNNYRSVSQPLPPHFSHLNHDYEVTRRPTSAEAAHLELGPLCMLTISVLVVIEFSFHSFFVLVALAVSAYLQLMICFHAFSLFLFYCIHFLSIQIFLNFVCVSLVRSPSFNFALEYAFSLMIMYEVYR